MCVKLPDCVLSSPFGISAAEDNTGRAGTVDVGTGRLNGKMVSDDVPLLELTGYLFLL